MGRPWTKNSKKKFVSQKSFLTKFYFKKRVQGLPKNTNCYFLSLNYIKQIENNCHRIYKNNILLYIN